MKRTVLFIVIMGIVLALGGTMVLPGKAAAIDSDGDGIDIMDNCPLIANPDQRDTDSDGIGDVCDDDLDGDGTPNASDNCPVVVNTDQNDFDGDSFGDVCDDDVDGDGTLNASDNCPVAANSNQNDVDMDGVGDVCDDDLDGDGTLNASDNCPVAVNFNQNDADMDGMGDVCDDDVDGDGILNASDNCPLAANSDQNDFDGDSFGDVCDDDVDGDGTPNASDNCPLAANSNQNDADSDGIGDVCDAASAGLSSSSITFNDQIIDTQSPPRAATFINSGTGSITISTIAVSGTNAGDFANNGTCANGTALASGETCTFQMVFTPSAAGIRGATLTVNAATGSHALSLSGAGIIADSAPDAFTFTDVSDVFFSAVVTSATVTITGINTAAEVSIVGGEYSRNGAAFTAASGLANKNDTFAVRHTASPVFGTATHTILTIGSLSDTFTSTTLVTIPDGDLDGDGSVTDADVERAMGIAAGLFIPTATDQNHGDVAPLVAGTPQPDRVINIGDVVVILKKSRGLVP